MVNLWISLSLEGPGIDPLRISRANGLPIQQTFPGAGFSGLCDFRLRLEGGCCILE